MKNITVSVDDAIYHRARIRAAELKSSVSALVKKFLVEIVEEETVFERLKREENELRERLKGRPFSAAHRISREELHERDALR
jgi:hypothetical protein